MGDAQQRFVLFVSYPAASDYDNQATLLMNSASPAMRAGTAVHAVTPEVRPTVPYQVQQGTPILLDRMTSVFSTPGPGTLEALTRLMLQYQDLARKQLQQSAAVAPMDPSKMGRGGVGPGGPGGPGSGGYSPYAGYQATTYMPVGMSDRDRRESRSYTEDPTTMTGTSYPHASQMGAPYAAQRPPPDPMMRMMDQGRAGYGAGPGMGPGMGGPPLPPRGAPLDARGGAPGMGGMGYGRAPPPPGPPVPTDPNGRPMEIQGATALGGRTTIGGGMGLPGGQMGFGRQGIGFGTFIGDAESQEARVKDMHPAQAQALLDDAFGGTRTAYNIEKGYIPPYMQGRQLAGATLEYDADNKDKIREEDWKMLEQKRKAGEDMLRSMQHGTIPIENQSDKQAPGKLLVDLMQERSQQGYAAPRAGWGAGYIPSRSDHGVPMGGGGGGMGMGMGMAGGGGMGGAPQAPAFGFGYGMGGGGMMPGGGGGGGPGGGGGYGPSTTIPGTGLSDRGDGRRMGHGGGMGPGRETMNMAMMGGGGGMPSMPMISAGGGGRF